MRIICAKCHRDVEHIAMTVDVGFRSIVAFCHGERDEMTLTDEDLQNMTAAEVRQIERGTGVAFASGEFDKFAAVLLADVAGKLGLSYEEITKDWRDGNA